MTVESNFSRNDLISTGAARFDFTFQIEAAEDLNVYVDGVEADAADYTVSNVGNESGGYITFKAGEIPTSGARVTMLRDMAYERTQDYQSGGPFLASNVNSDYDRLWLIAEQNRTDGHNALRLPDADPTSDPNNPRNILPSASERALKLLAFDQTGHPIVSSSHPGIPDVVTWADITGDQSVVSVGGFTNDVGYLVNGDLPLWVRTPGTTEGDIPQVNASGQIVWRHVSNINPDYTGTEPISVNENSREIGLLINTTPADYNGGAGGGQPGTSAGFGGLRLNPGIEHPNLDGYLEIDTNNVPLDALGNMAGTWSAADINPRINGEILVWRNEVRNTGPERQRVSQAALDQWGGLWVPEIVPYHGSGVQSLILPDATLVYTIPVTTEVIVRTYRDRTGEMSVRIVDTADNSQTPHYTVATGVWNALTGQTTLPDNQVPQQVIDDTDFVVGGLHVRWPDDATVFEALKGASVDGSFVQFQIDSASTNFFNIYHGVNINGATILRGPAAALSGRVTIGEGHSINITGDVATETLNIDVADNSIGAEEIDVAGNGNLNQRLVSDGQGGFLWANAGGGGGGGDYVASEPITITTDTIGLRYNSTPADYNATNTGFGGLRLRPNNPQDPNDPLNQALELDVNNIPLDGLGNIAGSWGVRDVTDRRSGEFLVWRNSIGGSGRRQVTQADLDKWGGLWVPEDSTTAFATVGINLNDDIRLTLGTTTSATGHGTIAWDSANSRLAIQTRHFQVQNDAGHGLISTDYNNVYLASATGASFTTKLQTTSSGVQVNGDIGVSSGVMSSDSDIYIRSNTIALQNSAGNQTMISAQNNAGVSISYGGANRIQTLIPGVRIHGQIEVTDTTDQSTVRFNFPTTPPPAGGYAMRWNHLGHAAWVPWPTTGGIVGISALVEDHAPTLGGNLDVAGFDIISTSNRNIDILANNTGNIRLNGNGFSFTENAHQQPIITASTSGVALYHVDNNVANKALDTINNGIQVSAFRMSSGSDFYTLPTARGSEGFVLTQAANGEVQWQVGSGGLAAVVDDTTPQLGGSLDTNGHAITSANNANVTIDPQGAGTINLGSHVVMDNANAEIHANGLDIRYVSGATNQPRVVTSSSGVALWHNANKRAESAATGFNVIGSLNMRNSADSATTYALPQAAGTSGQVLAMPSTGTTLEWVANSGGGSLPSFTGNAGKTLVVNTGETAAEWSDKIQETAGGATITGALSVTAGLSVHSGTPANSYELPNTQGSSGQVMTSDGAGGVAWVTPSGGGTTVVANPSGVTLTDSILNTITIGSTDYRIHVYTTPYPTGFSSTFHLEPGEQWSFNGGSGIEVFTYAGHARFAVDTSAKWLALRPTAHSPYWSRAGLENTAKHYPTAAEFVSGADIWLTKGSIWRGVATVNPDTYYVYLGTSLSDNRIITNETQRGQADPATGVHGAEWRQIFTTGGGSGPSYLPSSRGTAEANQILRSSATDPFNFEIIVDPLEAANLAVGQNAVAGSNSVSVGKDSTTANISNSVAVGNTASCSGTAVNAVAVGQGASATNIDSIAIGGQAVTAGSNGFSAGYQASAGGGSSIAIGLQATAGSTGSGNMAIGSLSDANNGGLAVGIHAQATTTNSICICTGKASNPPTPAAYDWVIDTTPRSVGGVDSTTNGGKLQWDDSAQNFLMSSALSTDDADLHVEGNIVAYSTTASDERLKFDIKEIDSALDKVDQIRGVTFHRVQDGKQSAGVIAQDIEKVLPQAVEEMELPLIKDDGEEYKTVNYDALHGLLIEAVKELRAEVKDLRAQLEAK